MNFAEHILKVADEAFRYAFEAELRKRLLDQATAEIEHIVREVSSKVIAHTRLTHDRMRDLAVLDMDIKVVK
jgi:hypothetical protein